MTTVVLTVSFTPLSDFEFQAWRGLEKDLLVYPDRVKKIAYENGAQRSHFPLPSSRGLLPTSVDHSKPHLPLVEVRRPSWLVSWKELPHIRNWPQVLESLRFPRCLRHPHPTQQLTHKPQPAARRSSRVMAQQDLWKGVNRRAWSVGREGRKVGFGAAGVEDFEV